MNVSTIKLSEVEANQDQPRKDFNEDLIAELAESISKEGLMTPIMVRKVSRDTKQFYEIVQGERRFRACKQLGLTEIEAVIREDLTDEDAFHLAVIENIQREQLSPIEEARAFQKYIEQGYSHEQIANKVSKSRTYVTTKLRLLKLIPEIQDWIAQGKLSEGHAKQLLKLQNLPSKSENDKPFKYAQKLFLAEFEEFDKVTVNEVKEFSNRVKQGVIIAIITVFNGDFNKPEAEELISYIDVDILDITKVDLNYAMQYEIDHIENKGKMSELFKKQSHIARVYEVLEEQIFSLSEESRLDKWIKNYLEFKTITIQGYLKKIEDAKEALTDDYEELSKIEGVDKTYYKEEAEKIKVMNVMEYMDYYMEKELRLAGDE